MTRRLIKTIGTGAALAMYSAIAQADYQLNLLPPKSKIAQDIYDLHTLILWVCVGIFVVVFGAMFYSIFKHRKAAGHKAANFHENTTVEVIWTIIPFFILAGMAYPATLTILEMKDTSDADMTVKVVGYQWKWEYDYLQDGVRFFSTLSTPRDQITNQAAKGQNYLLEVDNHMVVPVGKKVRVLITANDVLHAWWVPELGVKQDAIPGFIRDSWFIANEPGIYRGQCAELCGKDHGFMPIVVEAVEPEKYAAWVAERKGKAQAAAADANKVWDVAALKTKGAEVYAANCAACHQANGQGIPGAFPALTGSNVVTGPVAGAAEVVIHGRPGTAMQAFGKQLSDVELAAVITYVRNDLGNSTGDAVQPTDIQAMRK